MAISPIFSKSGEGMFATYSYNEVASGSGIIEFYCALDQSSNGILTTSSIYSDKIFTKVAMNADTTQYYKTIDYDFDMNINIPLNLKGITYVNVPFGFSQTTSGGGEGGFIYVITRLRKWDGASETEIANGTSRIFDNLTSPQLPYTFLIKFDTPFTHYKKGETLRLTIEMWSKLHGTNDPKYSYLGHDPQDRTWTGASPINPSQLKAYIPTKIDL